MQVFLASVLLATVGQVGNNPEKLFRAMEEKIARADTVQIAFETKVTFDDKTASAKGTLTYAPGGKARLALDMVGPEGQKKLMLVSNGTQEKVTGDGLLGEVSDTPKYYPKFLVKQGTEYGVVTGVVWVSWMIRSTEADALAAIKVHSFKLGKTEKVNGQVAQIVEYKLRTAANAPDQDCLVWIDTQTLLPLKRTVHVDANGSRTTFTETYLDFQVNPRVDAKLFELP